jgi:hypothetical protein
MAGKVAKFKIPKKVNLILLPPATDPNQQPKPKHPKK